MYEKIGDVHGAFDGLELFDAHTLIVSDWGAMDHAAGFVEKVDINTHAVTKIDMPAMFGPADFYFDAKARKLFVPELAGGKLTMKTL